MHRGIKIKKYEEKMDQINREVIEKVLMTYECISRTLKEIKEEIAKRRTIEEKEERKNEEVSTFYIINEFFSHLENERGRAECPAADKNKQERGFQDKSPD